MIKRKLIASIVVQDEEGKSAFGKEEFITMMFNLDVSVVDATTIALETAKQYAHQEQYTMVSEFGKVRMNTSNFIYQGSGLWLPIEYDATLQYNTAVTS